DEADPQQAALKRRFKCILCGNSFRQAAYLKYHMNTHTGNYGHKCDICSTGFDTPYKLSKHMERHRRGANILENNNTKRCTQCPKKYLSAKRLEMHVKQCHEGDIECDLCDQKFERVQNLNLHRGMK
ncbi:hypothetical protein PMAYCL1PPCAC_10378, partial [Pristionchus mayeri]